VPFDTPLDVRETGPRSWRLLAPLVYRGKLDRFVVPAGFDTDFATIPRWAWGVPGFSPMERHKRAAVLHDYLYRKGTVSRRDADGIFRRVMRETGTNWITRRVMWGAVRLFGETHWRKT